MMQEEFVTKGGIRIDRKRESVKPEKAFSDVYKHMDRAKGCILASDYEYPGRYSRWDIGFIDPPIELRSRGRSFWMAALNDRGKVLLKLLATAVTENDHIQEYEVKEDVIEGQIKPMPKDFPEEQRSKQPSIFSVLRGIYDLMACDDEYLSMFGAFGYDLVFQFEPIELRHDRSKSGDDCHLYLPDRIIAIDHQKGTAFRLSYEFTGPDGQSTQGLAVTGSRREMERRITSTDISCDHEPGEYAQKVEQIREGCRQGDFFEVVLSQVFQVKCGYYPMELFDRIRSVNPSPYDFLINLGGEQLVGASPEMFVRVDGKMVETCPISGTVQRGDDAMKDSEQIVKLLASKKDESELTMCTDVDRNDKSRVCVPGSVQLIGRRMVETYSKLFHTVDHVKGTLLPECDLFDALLTHMWACTLTGAPKPIAMQTIEDLEKSSRRWYGACVGLFTFAGQLNTGTTIRTIHLEDGLATVRAGATLLYDSIPDDEDKEVKLKASAFLQAATMDRYETVYDHHRRSKKQEHIRVLFVDYQDSFVHTLANYVRQTGAEVITLRSGFDESRLDELKPDLVFLSPGPETPVKRGVMRAVDQAVKRGLPVFGVCLGHQGIGSYFGAELGVMKEPMHGKESIVHHQQTRLFENVPTPFTAGRYHSLYVKPEGLPDCLTVTAQTEDGVIMSLEHKTLPVASIQFHPESILTLQNDIGLKIISNVIDLLT